MKTSCGVLLKRLTTIVVAALALCSRISSADPGYTLEVNKTAQTLLVKQGHKIERAFKVALGLAGNGEKASVGDGLTPTGTYRIVKLNEGSKFSLFMQLNYPNLKDAYYGLKHGLINQQEFNAILDALDRGEIPPQNTGLGGLIGIHGLAEANDITLAIHRNFNWTKGCIALTNAEIRALRRYVELGTRVVIRD
jgi:murein L,D-transpeptidase YafK